ncbi:uncharacterized protein N7479_005708 [Penicillium vulpinum]|uniref:uncharacterized protein n=1 Tax=Penicillium vulpinum TaxID=29845 RepID=UPI002547948D|nr:uncharacterized protein N7479_005708 [Penicillium vulpinum]KAJ5958558.1 hypothetical protein N7479_005708 [Penicillium vulpinum]
MILRISDKHKSYCGGRPRNWLYWDHRLGSCWILSQGMDTNEILNKQWLRFSGFGDGCALEANFRNYYGNMASSTIRNNGSLGGIDTRNIC